MSYNKHFSRLMLAVFLWTVAFGATIQPAYAASTHTDIDGHWAQSQIENLTAQAVISGYPDGTFKPEKSIARAEFATALVKAFKLESNNSKVFDDTADHWARDYIATAHAAGIVSGYSEAAFGPDDPINREQMAVMIVKAAGLENGGGGKAFADDSKISAWAKEAVSTAGGHNVISGYPDNTFRPQGNTTRAEAAVVLNNAMSAAPGKTEAEEDYSVISNAGTYGPTFGSETVAGNVSVQSPGVTLQNLIIQGDLTIAKEVGDGDVTLNHITVKGKTYIRGGGVDSIHIKGGQYSEIIVEKTATGAVRIAVVDNSGLRVNVAQTAAGEKIILSGEISRLTVNADNAAIVIQAEAKIGELKVASALTGVNIELAENSSVDKMTLDSETIVKGKGTIREVGGSKVKESSFATALSVSNTPTPVGATAWNSGTPRGLMRRRRRRLLQSFHQGQCRDDGSIDQRPGQQQYYRHYPYRQYYGQPQHNPLSHHEFRGLHPDWRPDLQPCRDRNICTDRQYRRPDHRELNCKYTQCFL